MRATGSPCRFFTRSSSGCASVKRLKPERSGVVNGCARAAAHVALAHRGSRLAVYDLRESLESADAPLPVEFLAALTLVGDRSCLEPIAAAYAHARGGHAWWRQHLADAFRAIAARERITRRNAVMKKIEKRWGKTRPAELLGGRCPYLMA